MSAADVSSSPVSRRYRSDYRRARAEARVALAELHRRLGTRCPLRKIADASRRAQRAAARLYTAAACLLSPP